MNKLYRICEVFWYRDSYIYLTFVNHAAGTRETRRYKTEAAAKAAETKYYKRHAGKEV